MLSWLQRFKTESIFALQDLFDLVKGEHDPLIPPRRLMFDGPRNPRIFRQNGEQFVSYYRELGKLQAHHAMLDIGSGIGRKTLPLITFLSSSSRYEGFDINPIGVEWCRKHISAQFPHFHFQQVDVYNQRYNPQGTILPTDFQFPYPRNFFDFATAMSVFTHMFASEVQHYLIQSARVLKPGGRTLFSFFILDERAKELRASAGSAYHFPHAYDQCWIERPEQPEDAVAYELEWIQDAYQQAGLQIERIAYGKWSGRPDHFNFQDLVVAKKIA